MFMVLYIIENVNYLLKLHKLQFYLQFFYEQIIENKILHIKDEELPRKLLLYHMYTTNIRIVLYLANICMKFKIFVSKTF